MLPLRSSLSIDALTSTFAIDSKTATLLHSSNVKLIPIVEALPASQNWQP